ncbi:MAG: hypothetical protein K5906_03305, partial [Bacilli bacterium]|nr:hypothetical protein [Bacilli bacterium]
MGKNRFFGKYYKFINNDGFSFAFITSHSNEGDMLQIITHDGVVYLNDPSMITINDNEISFNVITDNLTITGQLSLGELHPLKHKVMGPFTYLPLECSHDIYSMYHKVNGELKVNNKLISFNDGLGYIEGDKGVNFPTKYIWYNSLLNDVTVTLAIATIPMGLINFI